METIFIRKGFLYFLILFAYSSCHPQRSSPELELYNYYETEIADRIKVIRQIDRSSDTDVLDPLTIDGKVNKVILLSKDIENLNASVSLGNQLFDEFAGKYELNGSNFFKLNTMMHVDEISRVLKQNELDFFNLYILKKTSGNIQLHSVK